MMRQLAWLGLLLILVVLNGCAGDEKGTNQNKEKPRPVAK